MLLASVQSGDLRGLVSSVQSGDLWGLLTTIESIFVDRYAVLYNSNLSFLLYFDVKSFCP